MSYISLAMRLRWEQAVLIECCVVKPVTSGQKIAVHKLGLASTLAWKGTVVNTS